MNRAELKSRAKDQLKGKKGVLALVTAIPLIISIAVNLLTGKGESLLSIIASLIFSIFSIVLQYGIAKIYLDVANNREVSIYDMFSGFYGKTIFKTIGLALLLTLITLVPAAIIGVITFIATFSLLASKSLALPILIVLGVLAILAIVAEVIIVLMYSQVYYILCEDNDKGVIACMSESRKLMNGHKGEYFVLSLSFIGWSMLGAITCGIGFLWIIPYMQTTVANFYLELKKDNSDDLMVL